MKDQHDGLRMLAAMIAAELKRGGSGSPAQPAPVPRKPKPRARKNPIRCVSRLPRQHRARRSQS